MYTVKIREALKAGWGAFARRPWYLLGLMLAFAGIFVVSTGNAFVTALAYIAYGGYIAMFIKHFRGEHIEFDDMFSIDTRWVSFAFLGIIKTFLIILGFICFIVPGVYLAVRWMFAEMLVIDQDMRPLEALRASSKITAGTRGKLFLFALVTTLLLFVSALLLIVGMFVAALVVFFAYIHVYEKLKGKLHEVVPEVSAPQESAHDGEE